MATDTFGNTTAELAGDQVIEYIIRTFYDAPAFNGIAESISANLEIGGGYASEVKFALYQYVDWGTSYAGNLIASTNAGNITEGDGVWWITRTFPDPKPTVVAGTNYYIAAWADSAVGTCRLRYGANQNRCTVDAATYGAWPSPLVDAAIAHHYSLYCTYTIEEAVGGGLTLTLNPSPKGGIGRPPLMTGGGSFGG